MSAVLHLSDFLCYPILQDNYKKKICRELISNILARKPKMCSFIEWKELKIVYKRYASLYFCAAIDVRLIINNVSFRSQMTYRLQTTS